MKAIRVSADGHFLETEEGEPFFYLADTAWLLFNKLTLEEVDRLFADRAAKGFNAVQAVVFRDLFEPNSPNAAGIRPFATDADFQAVRMNPEWLNHVRTVLERAVAHGLYLALLPTWGDKWNEHSNSAGPVIMDAVSGRAYCRMLSDALGDFKNIFWMLGGDSPIRSQTDADVIRAMAEGLRAGRSGERLITFYPCHDAASDIFHSEPWLDFNCIQSGHSVPNLADYRHIETQYRLQPPKPCMNLEANFEACPSFLLVPEAREERPLNEPLFTAYDVRKCLYRSVLAGGAGFAYGCEPIRQLYRPGERVHVYGHYAMPAWTEALDAPGSRQMVFLASRLLERRYRTRMPAQQRLLPRSRFIGVALDRSVPGNDHPAVHVRLAECSAGGYLLIYCPVRQALEVDTSGLRGNQYQVTHYDPESGDRIDQYTHANTGRLDLLPARDLDTFIILDARD